MDYPAMFWVMRGDCAQLGDKVELLDVLGDCITDWDGDQLMLALWDMRSVSAVVGTEMYLFSRVASAGKNTFQNPTMTRNTPNNNTRHFVFIVIPIIPFKTQNV
jgi:hypothetical protein